MSRRSLLLCHRKCEHGPVSASIPLWEPLSEAALADQRGTYDRMRAACPLAESPRGVTLFRHADVTAAATDPARFSSAVSAHRQVPNVLDQPEHTAFRAAIDSFFAPERMAALEPRLRNITHKIISALPRDVTVDTVTDIGYPLAVRAQAEWLGWHGIENQLLAWMGENHFAAAPAALYGAVLLMAAVAYLILQHLIIASQGPDSMLKKAIGGDWKGKLSLLLYAAAIPVAFWWQGISLGLYVVVALLWLIPDRRIENVLRSTDTSPRSGADTQ